MKILIVGATSDIGYATLRLLSDEYEIIATGHSNKKRLYEISKIIGKENVINLDLTDALDTISKLSKIEVDCVIHLASVPYLGLIQDMSINDWSNILSINLTSIFTTTKAIIPNMLRCGGGKLLFISSIWARVGASYEVAYSASKGGVESFAKALSKELAPSNIAVNTVALGMVDTKMNSNLTIEEKNQIYDEIPFSRPATTHECAIFIKKIIEMPNYATGQSFRFDGGWY